MFQEFRMPELILRTYLIIQKYVHNTELSDSLNNGSYHIYATKEFFPLKLTAQ